MPISARALAATRNLGSISMYIYCKQVTSGIKILRERPQMGSASERAGQGVNSRRGGGIRMHALCISRRPNMGFAQRG